MWIRAVPAALVLTAAVEAQAPRVVDEGSFTFTQGGKPFGTEAFKIVNRRGADGMEYVAQCTRTLEGRIIRTSLTTDSAGDLTTYTRTATGAAPSRVTARRTPNRITVNQDGPQASSRDYAFATGTVLIDDEVMHQLYFVTWRDPRRFMFIVPGGRSAEQGTLVEVGRENVVIAGTTVPATRLSFGAGDARRDIWIDSGRRLLKVAVPARQIVVTRDLPPG